MADPFLLAHQVGPAVFDIGGKLYPVSIRDQMVRGQSIIDRAIGAGFGSKGEALLVIGAGAAGATAAIYAAAHGVTTHLIESALLPFLRQALCKTRWLHPHEYEWPLDHWPTPKYPYVGVPTVPLPWTAKLSDDLALGWDIKLKKAIADYLPRLKIHFGTRLAVAPRQHRPKYNRAKKEWTVFLVPPGSATAHRWHDPQRSGFRR